MQLNDQEVNKSLDKINELKELAKEANSLGKLNKQINEYISSEIASIFEEMKTEKYAVIRKHIYDLSEILSM